ncbi:protein-S-isoprenylcysteine O-methyltransferase Ste14 [Roseiarcus fermentans]|uniref:Protein-S-isoprenylcysteine O-methyltransferase Ste14 n=1 Tax=Roseiarcus fermentans TaxID=1473586 RepID=A0A366EST4_9HYPH|nr:isoprenylcysteine carboxylmethyltransferase family protein [Roseiarcus fermentans]RBP04579.1 protein-S-isoprenylcysteine O-methyltransferase Ste14 [Roseiarcus fermentans]
MPAEKDHADVLVPPPVALALSVAAAWLADRLWPAPFLPPGFPRWPAGGVVIALGLAIALAAIVQFRRAGTAVRPDRPSRAVLTTGPYRWSRNPIYLAMLLVVAGLAVALDSLWQLAALAVLYGVLRWGVVAREEAYLERKFGAAYRDYARRVRRWI